MGLKKHTKIGCISLIIVGLMFSSLYLLLPTSAHPHSQQSEKYKWSYHGDSTIDLSNHFQWRKWDLTYVIRGDNVKNKYWIEEWDGDRGLAPSVVSRWGLEEARGSPSKIAAGAALWIVSSRGSVFQGIKQKPTGYEWKSIETPKRIRDIATDGNGDPWIISNDGRYLYKWKQVNNLWQWIEVDSKGYDFFARISMSLSEDVFNYWQPWIVSTSGKVYQMQKNRYSSRIKWTDRTYNVGFAYDITCDPLDNTNVYVTGGASTKWGHFIFKLSSSRYYKRWTLLSNGLADMISVGRYTRLFVINREGKLFNGVSVYFNSYYYNYSNNYYYYRRSRKIPIDWSYKGSSIAWRDYPGDIANSPHDKNIAYVVRSDSGYNSDGEELYWIERVNKLDGSYELLSIVPNSIFKKGDKYPHSIYLAVQKLADKKELIWVVTTSQCPGGTGRIYQLKPQGTSYLWYEVTQGHNARDISAGYDGSIWIIGMKGENIYTWCGKDWHLEVYLPHHFVPYAIKITVSYVP